MIAAIPRGMCTIASRWSVAGPAYAPLSVKRCTAATPCFELHIALRGFEVPWKLMYKKGGVALAICATESPGR